MTDFSISYGVTLGLLKAVQHIRVGLYIEGIRLAYHYSIMGGKIHKIIGISYAFLAMVYFLAGTSSPAFSQETATIVGTVRDAQGKDVEGVKIIVKDSSGKVVARSIPVASTQQVLEGKKSTLGGASTLVDELSIGRQDTALQPLADKVQQGPVVDAQAQQFTQQPVVAPTQQVPEGNISTLGAASTLVDELSIGRQDTALQPLADKVQQGPVVDAQAQQFTQQPVMVHMVENLPVGQYVLTLETEETSYQGGTVVANLGAEGLTVNWQTTPNSQVIAVAKQGTDPVGDIEFENTSTVVPSAVAEGDLENEITASSSTEPAEFFGFGDTSPVVLGAAESNLDDGFGLGTGLFPIVEIEEKPEQVASPSQ